MVLEYQKRLVPHIIADYNKLSHLILQLDTQYDLAMYGA